MWTRLFGGSTLTTPLAHALLEGGKARAFACLALPKLACCWSFVRVCGFAQTCVLLVVRPRHFAQVDGCSCPFGLAWARHAYLRIHGVAPHPATLIRLLERAASAAPTGEMDTGSGSGSCMCDALGQDALALAMLTAAMLQVRSELPAAVGVRTAGFSSGLFATPVASVVALGRMPLLARLQVAGVNTQGPPAARNMHAIGCYPASGVERMLLLPTVASGGKGVPCWPWLGLPPRASRL